MNRQVNIAEMLALLVVTVGCPITANQLTDVERKKIVAPIPVLNWLIKAISSGCLAIYPAKLYIQLSAGGNDQQWTIKAGNGFNWITDNLILYPATGNCSTLSKPAKIIFLCSSTIGIFHDPSCRYVLLFTKLFEQA